MPRPSPHRPFTPDPEQMALRPAVSGNAINGLGEEAPRAPRLVYWAPDPDDIPHGEMQRWFYTVKPGHPALVAARQERQAVLEQPLADLAEIQVTRSPADWTAALDDFVTGGVCEKVGVAEMDPAWAYEGQEVPQSRVIMIAVKHDYTALSKAPAPEAGAEVVRGMTEQLLVATIDTSLMAQNIAIAAESEGLGLCYIGGIRNIPAEVSELLRLPEHVYPVFGMCLGYPDQNPEIKPRLPVEAVLFENEYDASRQQALVQQFDEAMNEYYLARTDGNKDTDWSRQLAPLFSGKLRPHMREFLKKQGFELK